MNEGKVELYRRQNILLCLRRGHGRRGSCRSQPRRARYSKTSCGAGIGRCSSWLTNLRSRRPAAITTLPKQHSRRWRTRTRASLVQRPVSRRRGLLQVTGRRARWRLEMKCSLPITPCLRRLALITLMNVKVGRRTVLLSPPDDRRSVWIRRP